MADLNYYLGPWRRDAEQNAWVAPSGTVGLLDFGSLNDCALSPSARDMRGIGLFCTPRSVTLPSEYDLLDSGDCREIQVIDAHRNIVEAVLGVRIEAGGTLAEACAALFAAGDPTGQERWKPLTPTREGVYEIHLGGHSTIFSRKFDGPADKTWNKLRDLLRHDINQHDRECKAEAKRLRDAAKELRKQKKNTEADACDARAAKVENHAEKVLDARCRKYRCLPSELSQTIRRSKASTTIQDDFNRADGDTIGNQLTWTETAGDWDTSSNRAMVTGYSTLSDARAESSLSDDDHYAQAVITGGIYEYGGVNCRFSSSARTYYTFRICFASSDNSLRKYVDGSGTTLAYNYYTPASGATIKVDITGTTLKGFDGGTEKASATDSAISGNYRCGLIAYLPSQPNDIFFDDFYATDGIAEGHPTSKRFGGVPFAAVNRGVW